MAAEASKDFRAVFDPEKQSIERELAELNTVPKDKIQAVVDNILQRIHALEKTVTDKITVLPPYDVRICLEAVKSMSETLSQLRGKLVPKPKFSFKSRKALTPTPSSPSALAVSSTPIASNKSPKPSESTIDERLFMKFEDRVGEHLFIGTLEDPDSTAQMDQTIYLGGVPVESAHSVQRKAKDVALTNLTDCTVNLVHSIPLGAIHIRNLKRCTLVIPPVSGSILLHDCEGCVLIGACHQSRMHTSTDMDIYLHVTSEPIIEDCTEMRFASYPYQDLLPTDQLHRLFAAVQLNSDVNYYDRVKDFNWLRQQKSPNWRLLEPHEVHNEIAQTVLAKDGMGPA
ncbi:tubulin binding cofactor C-domain-containing protein [Gamsiella multidivaricata]|uniref:tubulin binding cofactor C-domain-containing protein n=1 Tax=Gamsiella multidivaricata TaxID=101098 RepID=UPI0022200783|nr:tubulin binding cofactor C-domain-containing protein [Gamsiella multidivaricata]KAG0367207.1 hypothetical protein BGZ54_004240 [Gamsiella multidivaricata]KAI7832744.1 tubulin binding cofactor C-domain-containing protein [Gamsiella multidivaricata]